MNSEKCEQNEPLNLNDDYDNFAEKLVKLICERNNQASEETYNDGGTIIAINGKWGTGKSFFLNWFITNKIEKLNESILPIQYNAWKNDYMDPLISLVGQICKSRKKINKPKNPGVMDNFKITAGNIIQNFTPTKMIRDIVNESNEMLFDNIIQQYSEHEGKVEEFKKALSELEEDKIKLIIIDELDRCKPAFALQFLERIKHFFNTKNVVFIITIDQLALIENIKKIYGQNFDSEHYLSRFFNFPLELPNSKNFREKFLNYKYKPFPPKYYNSVYYRELINFFEFTPREITKFLSNAVTITESYESDEHEILALLIASKISRPSLYADICNFQFIDSNAEENTSLSEDLIYEGFKKFAYLINTKKANEIMNWNEIKGTTINHYGIKFKLCRLYFMIMCLKSNLEKYNNSKDNELILLLNSFKEKDGWINFELLDLWRSKSMHIENIQSSINKLLFIVSHFHVPK